MNNILFRCDGSLEIGMGHVVRCLALADKLSSDFECKINFLMIGSELGIKKVKKSYAVIKPSPIDFNYKNWLMDSIKITESNILILDVRDNLSINDLNFIKENTKIKIVSIDDPEDKRLASDLLFYPPVLQIQEMDWSGFKGKVYCGWEYVLLRKEFLKKYTKSSTKSLNILVSMGATDPLNMTNFVIKCLKDIKKDFIVTIVLGDGYKFRNDLEKQLLESEMKYCIKVSPKNIARVFSQSNFAIISFGQTAYELAAIGIPSIYLYISSDHEKSSQIFLKNGIGLSAGQFKESKKIELKTSIMELINNPKKLIEMSKCSRDLNVSNMELISNKILLK